MKKKKVSLNNPWFVTLISTMVGIIAGLYITSYFQENKLYTAKEKALSQVKEELYDNRELLKDFYEKLEEKFEPISFVFSFLNEERDLVIHKDSLSSFLAQTKLVFDFRKSIPVDQSHIELQGDLNFNLDSGLMGKNLSNIVWDSFKQTDFLNITDFTCITDIEAFYVLQKEINRKTENWKNLLYKTDYTRSKEAGDDFISTWQVLLFNQKLLLDYYESIDDVLDNCK
ncbi:MAG: hypothetical protein AAF617_17605 [Bacteroidota bacterium]